MTEEELNRMSALCDEIDQFINSKVKAELLDDNKHLIVNAMINVSTTTLAKVMLLVRDDMRQAVMQTAISITHDKIKEGDAMVAGIKAVLKAQSMDNTCHPWPPTKH